MAKTTVHGGASDAALEAVVGASKEAPDHGTDTDTPEPATGPSTAAPSTDADPFGADVADAFAVAAPSKTKRK